MHSTFNDASKRTSISQLLNPLANTGSRIEPPTSSSRLQVLGPNGPFSGSQDGTAQNGQNGIPDASNPGSSFQLRSASWEAEQTTSQRPDFGHFPSNFNLDPRASKSRGSEGNFNGSQNAWPAQNMHDMPYGTSALAPTHSDERSSLSGNPGAGSNTAPDPSNTLSQQARLTGGFQFEQMSSTVPSPSTSFGTLSSAGSTPAWQNVERASTRILARSTANDASGAQQTRMGEVPVIMSYPIPPPGAVIYAPALSPVPAPTAPQKTQKRRANNAEDGPQPKKPRAKSNAKPTSGSATAANTSKRGYSAKKRNEAAQIAAQSAQLMPHVSYSQPTSEQGKAMRIVEDGNHPDASGPLQPELQFARCMSNRYKNEQFPRCVSCTRRWAGDTCRFQGIRFFLKNTEGTIVGISFVENQKPDAPAMTFPAEWNAPLEKSHIRRTKRAIAAALLPVLQQELEHLHTPEVIHRPRESEVRATCDTCMTSLFSSSWMCRLCGREACAECFQQVKNLTGDSGTSAAEAAAMQVKREKHSHTNPFFLSCTRRHEHQAVDFSPMSRFCKSELSSAIAEMESLLRTEDPDAVSAPDALGDSQDTLHTSISQSALPSSNDQEPASLTEIAGNKQIDPASISPADDLRAADAIPCHTPRRFTDAELTEGAFRPMWAKGDPMVVVGLLPKFKIQWTPEYFMEKYDSQPCLILECQSDQNKRITVGEFFSWFGNYEGRTECWKLKDWPPSTDFKTAFPELFEDFSQAVPVPNYVRRDGTLNISSHFPTNTVAPDLGPKMYNSMASFMGSGSKGSTRLHMDMADALNIMTYAALTPDGRPGCAAWDLFKAEDSEKLRQFLRIKFKGIFQHDPIHSQQFYLDTTLRRELWEEFGVKSYRVYQKPGEAVFIPAGCAHQVANLADCVKVAVDFVSPENIQRCEKLTKEFREQNQSMVWKEDVLQLRTMMWFAWLNCGVQEKERASR